MARLAQLVVDCRRPASLARFWAAVLDDFEIRDYDEEEITRLASIGRTPETDPCIILDGPTLAGGGCSIGARALLRSFLPRC